VVRLPGLFDKHDLTHLASCTVLYFKQNVDTKCVIPRPQVKTVPAGAAPLEDIHCFVC
jgi:hypothetical protein